MRVREEMRAKDTEGKVVRERQEEERKVQEKTREARNREWRQKKEELKIITRQERKAICIRQRGCSKPGRGFGCRASLLKLQGRPVAGNSLPVR